MPAFHPMKPTNNKHLVSGPTYHNLSDVALWLYNLRSFSLPLCQGYHKQKHRYWPQRKVYIR